MVPGKPSFYFPQLSLPMDTIWTPKKISDHLNPIHKRMGNFKTITSTSLLPPVAIFHDKSGRDSTVWCKSGAKTFSQQVPVILP